MRYITAYSLDFSKCCYVHYEGWFSLKSLNEKVGMRDYLYITSHQIFFIKDSEYFLSKDLYDGRHSFFRNNNIEYITEKEFNNFLQPEQYKAEFNTLLD